MENITNYQCPACTGPLHFNGASGKLECEYCGSAYTLEEIEKLYPKAQPESAPAAKAAPAKKSAPQTNEWGAEASTLQSYNCPSCGAELVCDKTTAATACPYCGNNTVIPGRFSGGLKPDLVLPFKTTKEDALNKLKDYYKGKKLLPPLFSEENQLEKVQGVYVPFWLFDGKVTVDAHYEATSVNVMETRDERITETSFYDLYRKGVVTLKMVPVDASNKMADDLMESLEPFDFRALKPFSSAYLPGYLADQFDVSREAAMDRAEARSKNSAARSIGRTHEQYTTVMTMEEHLRYIPQGAKYVLLPVWMLTTRFEDQPYTFAMNGQTGEFIGDLPIDKKLFQKYKLMYTLGIAAAVFVPLVLMLLL